MNHNPFLGIMTTGGGTHLLVDRDLCYGCGACVMVCPLDALRLVGWRAVVDADACTLCDHCLPSCPVDALSMEAVT
jgi:ferredoxin